MLAVSGNNEEVVVLTVVVKTDAESKLLEGKAID
jgi:hypothetical protein